MYVFLIITAVTILLLAWVIRQKWVWKVVMVSNDPTHDDEIINRTAIFDQHQIRYKIKKEVDMRQSIPQNDSIMNSAMHPSQTTTKLLVHKKDLDQLDQI